jgi:hypothetical protein
MPAQLHRLHNLLLLIAVVLPALLQATAVAAGSMGLKTQNSSDHQQHQLPTRSVLGCQDLKVSAAPANS